MAEMYALTIAVNSSNLSTVSYDPWQATLAIEFHGGRSYVYYGVPWTEYVGLLNAASHGKYFHANIRDRYAFRRLAMRNGKIARLPSSVQEELNLRLNNNEDGAATLEWLNGLPETIELASRDFNGVPISKQNLYEWRQGGFREWRIRSELAREAGEMSSSAYEIGQVADVPELAGDLVTNLAARYAAILNSWDGNVDRDMNAKLRVLRGLAQDLALVQRTIDRATRQKNEFHEHLEEERKRSLKNASERALAPIWAKIRASSLAEFFGGTDQAKRLAEFVSAIQ